MKAKCKNINTINFIFYIHNKMKDFNPKQDIFSIISLPSTTAWTEAKTEELTDYFEQFINHIRKSAYSMSEEKYIGFNLACDNIIQQLNLSYIDYTKNIEDDKTK